MVDQQIIEDLKTVRQDIKDVALNGRADFQKLKDWRTALDFILQRLETHGLCPECAMPMEFSSALGVLVCSRHEE